MKFKITLSKPLTKIFSSGSIVNYYHSPHLYNWSKLKGHSRESFTKVQMWDNNEFRAFEFLHLYESSYQNATFLLNQDSVPSNITTNLFFRGTVSFSVMRTIFQFDTYSYLPHLFYCPPLQETLGLWEPKMSNKQNKNSLK